MNLGLVTAVVVVAVILALVLARVYMTDRRRMTSRTNGRIVSASQRVIVDETARRTETEVVAQFTAGGREHQVRRVLAGERAGHFPPGREVPIRYNPGEPSMAELIMD